MNEADIRWAAEQQHACPNVRKGLRLLARMVEAVNEQSDGWPYWSAPSRAAERLMRLLQTAGNLQYGTRGTISDADLRKAVTPIRTMITRQRKLQARYGNAPFEFDVDAALADPEPCVAKAGKPVSPAEHRDTEEQFCAYAKLLYRMRMDRAELYFLLDMAIDEVDDQDLAERESSPGQTGEHCPSCGSRLEPGDGVTGEQREAFHAFLESEARRLRKQAESAQEER